MCDCAFVAIFLGDQGLFVLWVVDESELYVNELFEFEGLPCDWVGDRAVGFFEFLSRCRWSLGGTPEGR